MSDPVEVPSEWLNIEQAADALGIKLQGPEQRISFGRLLERIAPADQFKLAGDLVRVGAEFVSGLVAAGGRQSAAMDLEQRAAWEAGAKDVVARLEAIAGTLNVEELRAEIGRAIKALEDAQGHLSRGGGAYELYGAAAMLRRARDQSFWSTYLVIQSEENEHADRARHLAHSLETAAVELADPTLSLENRKRLGELVEAHAHAQEGLTRYGVREKRQRLHLLRQAAQDSAVTVRDGTASAHDVASILVARHRAARGAESVAVLQPILEELVTAYALNTKGRVVGQRVERIVERLAHLVTGEHVSYETLKKDRVRHGTPAGFHRRMDPAIGAALLAEFRAKQERDA